MRTPYRLLALSALTLAAAALTLGLAPRPAQPDAATITDGQLTDTANVKAVLESLAYAPTSGGGDNLIITRKLGEWEVSFYLTLNADQTVLWIKCYLGRLVSPTTYDTSHYLTLLEEQGRISPRLFFTLPVEGGDADLWVCRGLDNRALTPELINGEIAALQQTMANCVNSWNFIGWTRAGEPEAQPPEPSAQTQPAGETPR